MSGEDTPTRGEALRDLGGASAATSLIGGILGGTAGGAQGVAIGLTAGAACPATMLGIGVCGLQFSTPEQRQALVRFLRGRGVPEQQIEMILRGDVESPNFSIGLSETGEQVLIEHPGEMVQTGEMVPPSTETGEMVPPTIQTMNPLLRGSPQSLPEPDSRTQSGVLINSVSGELFNEQTGEYFIGNPMFRPQPVPRPPPLPQRQTEGTVPQPVPRPPPVEEMQRREAERVAGDLPSAPTHTPDVQQEMRPLEREGPILSHKKGGLIKRTGLAYLHKGEYVVPVKDVKKCNVCTKR